MEPEIQTTKHVPSWLRKALLFVGGVAATHGFSLFGDYVIFPVVTYALGFWKSLPVLFLISLFVNYVLVLVYDLMKKDLFGFEEIKKMKADGELPGNKKMLVRLMRWGDIPFFIALSWYDPFFAVIYKRKSSGFDGFTKRDYRILVVSTFIGATIWSGMWSGGFYLLKALIHAL